jgi:hypothetical protein
MDTTDAAADGTMMLCLNSGYRNPGDRAHSVNPLSVNGVPVDVAAVYARAVRVAAAVCGASERALMNASSGGSGFLIKRARHRALYIAVTVGNAPVRAVARAARMTPEGVRKAVMATEARRDCPATDKQLNILEGEYHAAHG